MTIFYRRFFLSALLAAALAAPAAAKKPRNPKYDKRRKQAAASVKPKAAKGKSSSRPAPPPAPRLSEGRWSAPVKKAIEDLIAQKGKSALLYDPQRPPVAVLPWDDSLITGDAGDAGLARLIERVDFKFTDEFWKLIPLGYGRQSLRSHYESLQQEAESAWPRLSAYQKFRKDFLRSYQDMCGKAGRKECRVWLAQLLVGFKEVEISAYAQTAAQSEFQRPLEEEKVRMGAGDSRPVVLRRGLAAIPEARDLIQLLLSEGFDVWVLSDAPQAFVEASAARYGVDPSRAVGVRVKIKDGRLTSEVLDPVPFRGGKAGAVATYIGRPPALVLGADPWDIEMMEFSAGTRVLLDKGDGALKRFAEGKGWLIQPAFALAPPSQ